MRHRRENAPDVRPGLRREDPHVRRRPAGFTLIEMLVATVLSAVLIGAVLSVLAGVARDRRVLRSLQRPSVATALDLVEWDLRNAQTMSADGEAGAVLVLVGNDGIAPASLQPDGRRVRVVYRVAGRHLWRQQEYLDDPARPDRWQERVATDAVPALRPPPTSDPTAVPSRVRVDMAGEGREVIR